MTIVDVNTVRFEHLCDLVHKRLSGSLYAENLVDLVQVVCGCFDGV